MQGSLRYLSLQNTRLSHSPAAFLSPLSDLEVLDFGGTPTSALDPGTFANLTQLEELILTKSVMLSTVKPGSLDGLHSLKILKMDMCRISSIPVDALTDVGSMVYLHLDQNVISSIPRHAFSKLPKLEKLTLSGNRLMNSSYIDRDAFVGLEKNLKELDLSVNSLSTIPKHAFHPLKGLKKLHLQDNYISHLGENTFDGLSDLEELDLSRNSLSLRENSLAGVEESLHVLKLAHMKLGWDTLPMKTLKRLSNLQHLDLTGNQLLGVPQSAFEGLSIQHLTLSYCGINAVHPKAFYGLKPPLNIQLNHNNINNVTFLADPCHFHTVELYQNPVHCDCQFHQVSFYDHMTIVGACATPPGHEGHKLSDFIHNMLSSCEDYAVVSEGDNKVKDHKPCKWREDDRRSTSSGYGPSTLLLWTVVTSITMM